MITYWQRGCVAVMAYLFFAIPCVVAQEKSSDEASATVVKDGSTELRPRLQETLVAGKRTLMQYLMLSGICGALIVGCSIVALTFVIEHALTIRKGVLMPDEVVAELEKMIRSGQLAAAMELCQQRVCLFTNIVHAALQRYTVSEFGFAEYRAAAEEAGEEETGRLYRKTEVLNVIGAISPMLGLTGTVLGMIKSFNVIAESSGMARPDQLAGGISEALITTLMGLFVAIPTMVFWSYFRHKIDSLVTEAGKRVEQVLMPLGRRVR